MVTHPKTDLGTRSLTFNRSSKLIAMYVFYKSNPSLQYTFPIWHYWVPLVLPQTLDKYLYNKLCYYKMQWTHETQWVSSRPILLLNNDFCAIWSLYGKQLIMSNYSSVLVVWFRTMLILALYSICKEGIPYEVVFSFLEFCASLTRTSPVFFLVIRNQSLKTEPYFWRYISWTVEARKLENVIWCEIVKIMAQLPNRANSYKSPLGGLHIKKKKTKSSPLCTIVKKSLHVHI